MAEGAEGVIRRKLAAARVDVPEGGPGADRGWRLALARAARDVMKLPLDVPRMVLSRAGLSEILELPPERALVAVLEGPDEGLGVLLISSEVMSGLIEALTMGKVAASAPAARRPTRTDAAMLAPFIDKALKGLERVLAEEADLVWAGGFRYASFLDDPRPLGLLLEDGQFRVLSAEVSLGHGQRNGAVILILPADGRGERPQSRAEIVDDRDAGPAFSKALAERVAGTEAVLEAVIARVQLPLSQLMSFEPGDILPLPRASIDRIALDGIDGRRVGEGKLGQNRGMRAVRLQALETAGHEPSGARVPHLAVVPASPDFGAEMMAMDFPATGTDGEG